MWVRLTIVVLLTGCASMAPRVLREPANVIRLWDADGDGVCDVYTLRSEPTVYGRHDMTLVGHCSCPWSNTLTITKGGSNGDVPLGQWAWCGRHRLEALGWGPEGRLAFREEGQWYAINSAMKGKPCPRGDE